MTKKAWIYVMAFIIGGLATYLFSAIGYFHFGEPGTTLWFIFTLLTLLMIVSQLFKTEAPTHQIYHPNLMFAFAGLLLLPSFLFNSMIIISHLVEWLKERLIKSQHLKVWYIQPFNISMHILIGLICQWLYSLLDKYLIGFGEWAFMGSVLVIAAMYTLLNHLAVGFALVLARGVSWRDSGILESESVLIDYAMLVMGFTVVKMMTQNLWLVIPALAPLYLIYRALAVPSLKKQASCDPKTGLWNSEYFRRTLQLEMKRSIRFNRPLVLIMADLDLLRNINNVYGHLAGDAVLIGVAEILKKNFREYDTVSRFGGEEYAILMPETTIQQAFERVEAIRVQVEKSCFYSPISKKRIGITMSFGITETLMGDKSTVEIIHRADLAVYAAKMQGRNCTCISRQPFDQGVKILDEVLGGSVEKSGMIYSQKL